MKERGMLFSAPMSRALLDGSKTQTRRAVAYFQRPKFKESKDFPDMAWGAIAQKHARWGFAVFGGTAEECATALAESGCCPHGKVGDRIWVRETFSEISCRLTYRADSDDGAHRMVKRWTPSIHMPRAASRILLEITNVRMERLNDISEADARAEGCSASGWMPSYSNPDNAGGGESVSAADAFAALWESVYGAGSWAANPWVWAISFRRVAP